MQKSIGVSGVCNGIVDVIVHAEDDFLAQHSFDKGSSELIDAGKQQLAKTVELSKSERTRVYNSLHEMSESKGFGVKDSEANFLLLRFHSQDQAMSAYNHMLSCGVLVRNVSAGPGLSGCLRASIGSQEENDQLISALNRFN